MSALSNQLFHGTIENLKPGDVIKPGVGGRAWASSNLDRVVAHTTDRIASGLGYSSEGQHPHHGNIYEVEPIGQMTESPHKSDYPEDFVAGGFKVKGQVASVLNPDPVARKHRDPITNKERPLW